MHMIELDQKLINSKGQELAHGMTLRDHFAGQSINGLTASFKALGSASIASLAYDIADAMLAESEK